MPRTSQRLLTEEDILNVLEDEDLTTSEDDGNDPDFIKKSVDFSSLGSTSKEDDEQAVERQSGLRYASY